MLRLRGALRVSGAHHGAPEARRKIRRFPRQPPSENASGGSIAGKVAQLRDCQNALFAGEVLSVMGDTWARRRRARAILDHLGLVRAKVSKDLEQAS